MPRGSLLSASNRPSVSIVVATHNRRDWLRLAIDSVLGQDYADLELLVMDDGSTDDTTALLDEYASRQPAERFRFLRHENMGQARTLNRGYEAARGEVLGYLSDDDLLAPGAVSRLVEELAEPEIVCVYPGYRIIDVDGGVIDTVRPIPYAPVEAYRQMDTVIGPGGLVRRPVLEATGGWDPELRFMGDLILWMKVGLAGPVARVQRATGVLEAPRGRAEHPGGGGAAAGSCSAWSRSVRRCSTCRRTHTPSARRPSAMPASKPPSSPAGVARSPGERFATIDLGRAGTSAVSAGLGPTDAVDERADEASGLWREIALVTAELAEARAAAEGRGPDRDRRPGAGLAEAGELLRRAGALPVDGDGPPEARDLRMELMEAAVACGADSDPKTQRYLVLERGTGSVSDEEFDELNRLGFGASPDRLRGVIEDRRRKLEGTTSLPK